MPGTLMKSSGDLSIKFLTFDKKLQKIKKKHAGHPSEVFR